MLKKIVQLIFAFSIVLISANTCIAVQYSPDFKNCSITKLTDNLWRAKFTLIIDRYYGGANSTNNTFGAWVPQLNKENGKPYLQFKDRVLNPEFKNIETPSLVTYKTYSGNQLAFISSNSSGENVITSGGSFSIDFSVKNNDAYPALFISYRNLTDTGGGTLAAPLYIYPNSGCIMYNNPTIPPIDEVDPPDADFKLKSAIWNINQVDLNELPDVTEQPGFKAEIANLNNNKLCLSYVTKGVKKNTYSLTVNNEIINKNGKKFYSMKGENSKELFYAFNLLSDDGILNDFSYPSLTDKYISLSTNENGVSGRSEMCWTPEIYLFKDSSTGEGLYSEVINLTVSPKS